MNSISDAVRTLITENEDYVIAARRKVHTFAETGGNEHKTSAFIADELTRLGITVVKVSTTGLIGILDTEKPGRTLALRADIDALDIHEHPSNLKQLKVCISANPATCHACGHDAHTAMLLGTARVLSALKDSLSGKFLFCFEEGEESGLGLRSMLKALSEYQIDAVWALHVLSSLESGNIDISPGPRMAGAGKICMRVNGKSGHGSRPDMALNPVYAAAAITSNLPGALQSISNPDNPVTVSITSICGGMSDNIIPDYADIKGTIRFFDSDEGSKVSKTVMAVAENISKMLGCTIEFDRVMNWNGSPVINDRAVSEYATNAFLKLGFQKALTHCLPWYASESFAYYLNKYPGALAFLGIKNDKHGSGAPHHNERFDIDESALVTGLAANIAFALSDIL